MCQCVWLYYLRQGQCVGYQSELVWESWTTNNYVTFSKPNSKVKCQQVPGIGKYTCFNCEWKKASATDVILAHLSYWMAPFARSKSSQKILFLFWWPMLTLVPEHVSLAWYMRCRATSLRYVSNVLCMQDCSAVQCSAVQWERGEQDTAQCCRDSRGDHYQQESVPLTLAN